MDDLKPSKSAKKREYIALQKLGEELITLKQSELNSLPLDEGLLVRREQERGLLALDEALTALSALDERKGKVVELRFFGGLSVEETAKVLEVSPQTVLRDWRLAKAWLLREITQGAAGGA